MKIAIKKLKKDDVICCFYCGKLLSKSQILLNLGTPATVLELCPTCLRKLKRQIDNALIKLSANK
jgi:hypothetical protein